MRRILLKADVAVPRFARPLFDNPRKDQNQFLHPLRHLMYLAQKDAREASLSADKVCEADFGDFG